MGYYYIETMTKQGPKVLSWGVKNKKIKTTRYKIGWWFQAFRLLNGLRRNNPQFQYRLVFTRKGKFNSLKKTNEIL